VEEGDSYQLTVVSEQLSVISNQLLLRGSTKFQTSSNTKIAMPEDFIQPGRLSFERGYIRDCDVSLRLPRNGREERGRIRRMPLPSK
jgi:hypothetical protein